MIAILFPQINNIAVTIAGFHIYWYSIAYILGFVFGYSILGYLDQKNRAFFNDKAREDLLFFGVLFLILGGRLGYCFIYEFQASFHNPEKIFAIRNGGMSFHGGILGMTFAMYFVSKRHKIPFLAIADLVSIVAPIGLFFGRIANFINGELYGRVTEMPWGVIFPGAGWHPRHPSQIYEALTEGILLFIIMLILFSKFRKRKESGFISGAFVMLYGIFRILCESFREPDIQIGYLLDTMTMGQILSIPMILIGLYFVKTRRDVL